MAVDGRLILVSGGLVWILIGSDGDVSYFGVNCAKLIPRGRPAAEAWVQKVRTYLAECAQEKRDIKSADWLQVDEFASEDFWIEDYGSGQVQASPAYAMGLLLPDPYNFSSDYVINLDLLYFGFDSMPVYNLLHMPSTEEPPPDTEASDSESEPDFVRYLGRNAFGHQSWARSTPSEFRYDFDHGSHPPVPSDALLLRVICSTSTTTSMDSLLGPHRWKSSDEGVRVALLQAFVGMSMGSEAYYAMLRLPQIRQDMDPRNWRWAGEALMRVASRASYDYLDLSADVMVNTHEERNFDVNWPRENVCAVYARFLDSPSHQDAGIASVVKLARARYSSGFLWGVVFSVIRCIIVRIDARPGRPCTHTPALQFLPDWDDGQLKTEGTIALAQLFHIPPSPPSYPAKPLSPYQPLARLPLDVIHEIANAVERATDLWALAHAVPGLVDALGNRIRRGSYAGEHRLVKLLPSTRPLSLYPFLCVDKEGMYTIRTLYAKRSSTERCRESYNVSLSADSNGTWQEWINSMDGVGHDFKMRALGMWFCVGVKDLSEKQKSSRLSGWLSDVVPRPIAADFGRRKKEVWQQCEASRRRTEELIDEYCAT